MNLTDIDTQIKECNLCEDIVEKFQNSTTVSKGRKKEILILGDSATKDNLNIKYKKFSEVVGQEFYINNLKVIPIYHPSPISPKSYTGNIAIFKKLQNNLLID